MTFVRMAFFPAGTEEHYRRLADVMGDRSPPAGRLAFACGPVPGGWQVIQVWQSRAALEAFNTAHLFPAFRQLGAGGFPEPPVVVDFEPTDLQLRDDATAGTGVPAPVPVNKRRDLAGVEPVPGAGTPRRVPGPTSSTADQDSMG